MPRTFLDKAFIHLSKGGTIMSKLIILVGISGSGKSTVAKKLAKDGAIILSSDATREELFGSEGNQQNPGIVFDILHQRGISLLKNGCDVIYDATNLTTKRRTAVLNHFKRNVPNLRTECHLVVTDFQRCLDNQNLRERKVPEGVILKQLTQFNLPEYSEGWTEPIFIHNPFYRENLLSELLDSMTGISQKSFWHQETVDEHNLLVENYIKHMGYPEILQEVARYHDIGKPLTKSVDENGNTHFYGHANAGAYLYLCATAPTGILSQETWHRAALIQHHMDFVQSTHEQIKARVGEELYKELVQFNEADNYGAIRAEHKQMHVLDFLNTFNDWELRLKMAPFYCNIKHDGDYVLLQYQQLNSDFSSRVVQECRGSIFAQNEDGSWKYVCRPFDKFFNYGQAEAVSIDWNTARVLEKIDGCFSGKDCVLMSDGTSMSFNTIAKKIQHGEQLFVLSYNFYNQKVEAKRILSLKQTICKRPDSEWLTIRYKGVAPVLVNPNLNKIRNYTTITYNHVVFVRDTNGQIIEKIAGDLCINDCVISVNPNMELYYGFVAEITHGLPHGESGKYKFDIEVEDNHNYFCQGILVHNSLMKVWYHDNKWLLSTNGNIDAFKARVSDLGFSYGDVFNRALKMPYTALGSWLDPEYTYMFELTSPDTQLVVPYPDGVWYLSRRHTQSGIEKFDQLKLPGVKLPKQFNLTKLKDVLNVVNKMSKDEEGVVINDAKGNRIKVKSPEYLIAAHLDNNKMVSNRNLIVYMQEGKIDDFLGYCPQYTKRVQKIQELIRKKCADLDAAWEKYKYDANTLSRKEFSSLVSNEKEKNYLFTKIGRHELTSEQYLMSQLTPSLMRMLGLKNNEEKSEDIKPIDLNEEER